MGGPVMRGDMMPRGFEEGDFVYGLGAANPKCMVATLAEIATALCEARVPIRGDLIVAFAGGGMPVNCRRRNWGMSSGHLSLAFARRGA